MDKYALTFSKISKRFATIVALENIELQVPHGQFVAILGPSGSGKTTLLRVLAGLVMPTEGDVYLGERCITRTPPHRRDLGMVFQNYALFPHMTVSQNVAFGLRMRRLPHVQVNARVLETLALVRLEGFGGRFPHELSGGQQQRVALARSLAIRPSVLLLDEPLSALDKRLRQEMQIELRALQQQLGITALAVTHDQEEALTMADRIVVMNEGRVEQDGTPREIYESPRTKYVSQFIGVVNLFDGMVIEGPSREQWLQTPRMLRIPLPPGGFSGRVTVAIRPEKIRLTAAISAENRSMHSARIVNIVYMGNVTHYYVSVDEGDQFIVARQNEIVMQPDSDFQIGQSIGIHWDVQAVQVLK